MKNLLEVIGEVRRYLEQNGRVSLRMLRRQFDLDEESLEELIEELVDIQRVAVREDNALAWSGNATPKRCRRQPLASSPCPESVAFTTATSGERPLEQRRWDFGEAQVADVHRRNVEVTPRPASTSCTCGGWFDLAGAPAASAQYGHAADAHQDEQRHQANARDRRCGRLRGAGD